MATPGERLSQPEVEQDVGGEPATRYAERAVAALREAGLRITRPRRSIVELLERSRKPLTASAAHEELRRRRIMIDVASVYRTLAVLEAQGLIHRLSAVEGVVRCEPGFEGSPCHHHALCRNCGEVRELRCDGLPLLRWQVQQDTGFVVDRHAVELIGLCRECAGRRPAQG